MQKPASVNCVNAAVAFDAHFNGVFLFPSAFDRPCIEIQNGQCLAALEGQRFSPFETFSTRKKVEFLRLSKE